MSHANQEQEIAAYSTPRHYGGDAATPCVVCRKLLGEFESDMAEPYAIAGSVVFAHLACAPGMKPKITEYIRQRIARCATCYGLLWSEHSPFEGKYYGTIGGKHIAIEATDDTPPAIPIGGIEWWRAVPLETIRTYIELHPEMFTYKKDAAA